MALRSLLAACQPTPAHPAPPSTCTDSRLRCSLSSHRCQLPWRQPRPAPARAAQPPPSSTTASSAATPSLSSSNGCRSSSSSPAPATPALFVAIGNGFTVTYGLFHACIVTVVGTRKCYPYEDDGAQLLGSSHLGQEWSAYQALSVTLNVLAFAVGVLYTLRMAVLQRSKSLPRRSELALISAASFVLVLAVVSISLFVNCYNHVLLPAPVNVKTLGSSFTLSIAAYILQVSALLFHCYTYYQHTKASGGSVAAAAIPLRAGEPEPVPMAVVADPSAQYHPAYTPAAASYMQPAFYGQAYQLPQQYMQPAQGGAVPSYYSPPQYYAPAQQPQHMPAFAHQQPYPATPVVHYGEVAAAQQQAPMAAPQ